MKKMIYRCGTLSYTRLGLLNLFVWLLWGDFCYNLMECLTPTLVPLMLRQQQASNLTIGLLVGSIPSLLNFLINPVISTASDRTRSRWGRRRPYLLFTPPFVAVTLVLLGWSGPIGAQLYRWCWGTDGNPAVVIIGVIAVLTIVYQLFDLFVAAIFYYIFADVVPASLVGRFMALFRVVGTAAGMTFNLVVMPRVETHLTVIFAVTAGIYLLSFSSMCLMVKEGEYPPPEPMEPGLAAIFRRYFNDCFSTRFYVVLFIGLGLNYASTVCRNMFNLLYAKETLHIGLNDYGRIGAVCGLIAMCLYLPAGVLVDKYHPFRVYLAGALLVVLVNVFGFVFVKDLNTFWVVMVALAMVYVLQNSSTLPLCVALYPKEKFGQYCSAAAMVKAMMLVAANAGGGWFIDRFGYRYIFVWDFMFTVLCFGLVFAVFRRWKQLGGAEGFSPSKAAVPESVKAKQPLDPGIAS